MTLTDKEIQIFAHNQGVLRALFREQQKSKYENKIEKQKIYARTKRSLRKSSLSNF
jgi:hypothetical protein